MSLGSRRDAVLLGLVVLLALGLRLAPTVSNWDHETIFMQPDSWSYHQIAVNLLDGRGYSSDEAPPYEASVYRPPGLPALLYVVYGVTGASPSHFMIVQAMVGALVVVMTYLVARRLVGARAALVAALLLAIDPLSITYSNLLLTEVFSSLVLISFAFIWVAYSRTNRRSLLPVMGIVLGLGILVHPILIFTPVMILVALLLTRATRDRRQLAAAALGLALAIAPASWWVRRNLRVADYPGYSCVESINMLKYKAAGVMAEIRGTTREIERDRLRDECESLLPPGATRGARWQAWRRKGFEVLASHPLVYLKIHLKGMLIEFFGPGRDDVVRLIYGADKVLGPDGIVSDERIHRAVAEDPSLFLDGLRYGAVLVQGVVMVLFALGCVCLVARRSTLALLGGLLLPIVYVLNLTGGPEAFCRFRVLYMPFLCIVAALGLEGCRLFWLRGQAFGRQPGSGGELVGRSAASEVR